MIAMQKAASRYTGWLRAIKVKDKIRPERLPLPYRRRAFQR